MYRHQMYLKKNKVKKSSRHALARAFFGFRIRKWGKKRLASFDLIESTAVEGCSYAEGAQGDSDAVSL